MGNTSITPYVTTLHSHQWVSKWLSVYWTFYYFNVYISHDHVTTYCPDGLFSHLKNMSQIFPPTTGGAERMCSDLNLPLLGKVPLDPRIARSCDEGKSFLREVPDSPAAKVYQNIVQSKFFFPFLKCTHHHFSEARMVKTPGRFKENVDFQGSWFVFFQDQIFDMVNVTISD